jgi:acetyl-CoA C-acetyltransferase
MDPRTPVIVGAAQLSKRGGSRSPVELTAQVARDAEADAGAAGPLLARAGAVAVVDPFSWAMANPALLLAQELGISPAQTIVSARGGTSPVVLLGDLSARIARGELDCGLLAGGEVGSAFFRASRTGEDLGWPTQDPDATPAPVVVGEDRDPHHPAELAAGLIAPIFFYPLFEQAVRGAAGRSIEDHQRWLGELWGRFAAVARDNPHAWTRELPEGVEDVAAPSPANRMVSFPYPKLLNANIQVDQAAALVVMSAEAAAAAGVPRDRWVAVHAAAGAHDHWHVAQRQDLHRSPAIAAVGQAALGHAGVGIDDVAHLDLYSCFPSAVQIAAGELGVDLRDAARTITVTGGLTFAGGPANDYVTHSLATLVGRLREDPDALGAATAVGWYLTKHGMAVLGAREPERPFAWHSAQAAVDATPKREVAEGFSGTAPVETYTALYDRDGTATLGIVAVLLDDGSRALAQTQDRDVVAALLDGDALGREVELDGAQLVRA